MYQIRRINDDSPGDEFIAELVLIFRDARRERLQFLLDLHDAAEDAEYFRRVILRENEVWVGEVDGVLAGFIAFADGWVNQLYVAPGLQARGLGTELLDAAKRSHSSLQLWAFETNERAIRFYERRGFRVIDRTDGAGNEAKRPDVMMRWEARPAPQR
jgi:putative acetyltransferase